MNTNKIKWISAVAVFFVSLITYLLTMAPTVSLWDCGEFIACANIGGIPHPPGTPLFMILGRFFIVVFGMFEDVAFRVNLISSVSAAVGVFFTFLCTEKIIAIIFKNKFLYSLTGGLVAAFLLNFSDTYWFNAVEAEVYSISMTFLIIITWLSLLWFENKENEKGSSYILLIFYLAFLGLGMHLYTVMTIPAILLLMLISDKNTRNNWPLWLTTLAILIVVYDITKFLPIATISLLVWIVVSFVAGSKLLRSQARFCIWVSLVCLLGFSTYAYIPIRSALNPAIDENNPEIQNVFKKADWKAFNDFIARKQYVSGSMIERSLHRRGQLANQFLSHPHMGFGGYMIAQYLPWKVGVGRSYRTENRYNAPLKFQAHKFGGVKRLGYTFPSQMQFMAPYTKGRVLQLALFLLFNFLILWGVFRMYRHNKSLAIYVGALYFLSSFGLIMYLNFSDGTSSELYQYNQWVKTGSNIDAPPPTVRMEVRERDYFYAPAYMFMSMLLGISVGFLMFYLRESKNYSLKKSKSIAVTLIVLSFVVPCFSNYHEHNRSRNFIAFDYAKNMLASCLPNSILITNGDNDTFPLWYLQQAEGFRKDVKIVNLSLANTKWFVHQFLTHEPKLALGFTHQQIDGLDFTPNPYPEAVRVTLKTNKLQLTLPGKDKKPYFRQQDMVLLNLIQNNFPKKPVHVASTVGGDNLLGLTEYMKLDGMVYTLTNEAHNQRTDIERTTFLIDSVYQFRGVGDTTVYYNADNDITMYSYLIAFQSLFRDLGQEILTLKETEDKKLELQQKLDFTEKYVQKGLMLFSNNIRMFYSVVNLYRAIKEDEKSKGLLKIAVEKKLDPQFYINLSEIYQKENNLNKAKETLEKVLIDFPSNSYKPQIQSQIRQLNSSIIQDS